MTAPERIWAYPSSFSGWEHGFYAVAREIRDAVSYIRADAPSEAFAALPQVQALIAALSRERDDALAFLDNAVSNAPEPLADLGSWLADMLDEDQWPTAERYLNAAVKSLADFTAALARMLQEAEDRGRNVEMERVAQWCADQGWTGSGRDFAAAIRAMKGEKG